jgi:hypothetical protein
MPAFPRRVMGSIILHLTTWQWCLCRISPNDDFYPTIPSTTQLMGLGLTARTLVDVPRSPWIRS